MGSANVVRRRVLGALAVLAAPAFLHARAQGSTRVPPEVDAELPNAQRLGSGRLSFMLLHVYDARLWVRDGFNAADFAKAPLALELEYARTLYGGLIADRSLAEMRRSADLADITDDKAQRWLAVMKQLFVDVHQGDRITGVQVPGVATRIFVNGRLRGEVRDAEFTRLFFGIWLSPSTSEPALRDALLGLARAAS